MSGTFVAFKFDKDTINNINNIIIKNNIPNPIDLKELHCTVAYSRNTLHNIKEKRSIKPGWKGISSQFDVFISEAGKRCLVLRFNCAQVYSRHWYLITYENSTHDFPSYLPHISLSYDLEDFDVSILNHEPIDITIIEEFSQPLG